MTKSKQTQKDLKTSSPQKKTNSNKISPIEGQLPAVHESSWCWWGCYHIRFTLQLDLMKRRSRSSLYSTSIYILTQLYWMQIEVLTLLKYTEWREKSSLYSTTLNDEKSPRHKNELYPISLGFMYAENPTALYMYGNKSIMFYVWTNSAWF